ncbi:hypothetical protein G7K_3949-t1 [Saitoella complicata NRRL Y-17804]|uniref:Uncharacterized protein n=1 Tax=Saitoella complicata (strain BCRC 22490 / CBS 7301 / JCM 7358 / NBRC 10748 / NRRL Y-17804) TaxID=698492 RepID=A0A0E9NJD2_SAICN|nr:hypothetical protein G7K_3949-t1 [Saitoella complicata NRRL Y-17804]
MLEEKTILARTTHGPLDALIRGRSLRILWRGGGLATCREGESFGQTNRTEREPHETCVSLWEMSANDAELRPRTVSRSRAWRAWEGQKGMPEQKRLYL